MRLLWADEARRQLGDVRNYIEQDNPDAARSVVLAIGVAGDRLLDFPHLGWLDAQTGVRVCVVPRTPYRLHYVVEGDEIRILSVWHGARQWPPARD